VTTDEEWRSLVKAIGSPAWADERKFATLLGRKANEDEMDSLINDWTMRNTTEQVMRVLQAAGVASGMVQNTRDIFDDPQLRYRRHFQVLDHSEIGKIACQSPSYKLSKTPCRLRKAGPILGEHTGEILAGLGLSQKDIKTLHNEGVVGIAGPDMLKPTPRRPVKLGHIRRKLGPKGKKKA